MSEPRKEKSTKYQEYKLEYLKDLLYEEERRMLLFEKKISTLISQATGIITGNILILTIFVQFFDVSSMLFLVLISVFLVISMSFSLFSVLSSTRTLNIKKYQYMRVDENTVNHYHKKFLDEVIIDLKLSIANNRDQNNKKAGDVMKVRNYFRYSVISLFVSGFLLVLYKVIQNYCAT